MPEAEGNLGATEPAALKEAKILCNLFERAFVLFFIVLPEQARAAEPLHMPPQVIEPLLIPRSEWRNESFHSGFGQSDLSLRSGEFSNQPTGRIDAMPAVNS